jgi:hypothetical protein
MEYFQSLWRPSKPSSSFKHENVQLFGFLSFLDQDPDPLTHFNPDADPYRSLKLHQLLAMFRYILKYVAASTRMI